MIYITGDVHRDFDSVFGFCERRQTSKEDILIILGDAGINYYLNELDVTLKQFVQSLPITVFCIHGNHEQRPYMIDGYKEMQWHGGTVYAEDEEEFIFKCCCTRWCNDHGVLLFRRRNEASEWQT